MYKRVYFDISGVCNANCPYCVTGKKCVIGRNKEEIKARKFVSVEEFKETIDHLLYNTIIASDTVLSLYNWGEPFLHPNFEDILEILTERKLTYILSTNGSVLKNIPSHLLHNLLHVTFSMPGYSQNSYDRIHGFDFDTIKRNIITMVLSWRQRGYKGRFHIQMHLYQFNVFETSHMKAFAKELDISLSFVHATLNGYKLMESFLEDRMSYSQMKKTSGDLITYFYDKIERPEDFKCVQHNHLTINEHCELLPCCGVERGMPLYSFGKVIDMSLQDIINYKKDAEYCKICAQKGIDYFGMAAIAHPIGT